MPRSRGSCIEEESSSFVRLLGTASSAVARSVHGTRFLLMASYIVQVVAGVICVYARIYRSVISSR